MECDGVAASATAAAVRHSELVQEVIRLVETGTDPLKKGACGLIWMLAIFDSTSLSLALFLLLFANKLRRIHTAFFFFFFFELVSSVGADYLSLFCSSLLHNKEKIGLFDNRSRSRTVMLIVLVQKRIGTSCGRRGSFRSYCKPSKPPRVRMSSGKPREPCEI